VVKIGTYVRYWRYMVTDDNVNKEWGIPQDMVDAINLDTNSSFANGEDLVQRLKQKLEPHAQKLMVRRENRY
jgi:hypothetical protein